MLNILNIKKLCVLSLHIEQSDECLLIIYMIGFLNCDCKMINSRKNASIFNFKSGF